MTGGRAEEAGARPRRAPRPQVPARGRQVGVAEGDGTARGGASLAPPGAPGASAVMPAAEGGEGGKRGDLPG